ncbi:MAG: hypothetical protein ISR52_02265 [Rhodospirillales bacterium]|nr:hypothetical protein [Rhodospirillales bacterium]
MIFNRRTILRWTLKASALGLTGLLPRPLKAMVKPGMRRIAGSVRVNGAAVQQGFIVAPGDTVTTGPDGEAVMVIDANAYLMRPGSEVIFPERGVADKVLTVVSGKILSVFGPGRLVIDTPLASIGIRGTGCYVEASPALDYICLCYGQAILRTKLNPSEAVVLDTFHHDDPRDIHADPAQHGGVFQQPSQMVNHRDEELIFLEALVERIPLFGPNPIKMPDQK